MVNPPVFTAQGETGMVYKLEKKKKHYIQTIFSCMVFKIQQVVMPLGYKSNVDHRVSLRKHFGSIAIIIYVDNIIITATGDSMYQ